MFKTKHKLIYYALIASFFNVILYNIPFFKFVYNNVDLKTGNGILLILSLFVVAILLNLFVFYIGLYLLKKIGKWILIIFFIINAISVYFITNYGTLIDSTMMGNIFNTSYGEASSFFSLSLIGYLILLGIVPSIFIYKLKYTSVKRKSFFIHNAIILFFILLTAYINAPNWLWIDKNSKVVGSLIMPWSYVVNTIRFYNSKHQQNKKQKLLPDASITNNTKAVMVLVIGESARSANFSLYGYSKETNPLLSKVKNLKFYHTRAAATYTTAGVKAILDYKESNNLNEILPNYLYRNGVDVIWRTTNWGEPKVTIAEYNKREELEKICKGENCAYDEILLTKLKEVILKSKKDKILIVLHTSTSHGPTYYKKYPPAFNKFTPVCKSVELAKCTNEALINAYDNTILYTDYILARVIENLKDLKNYNTSMIYISDHGESLGEKNLYMHGIPLSIAPKEQFEIPFIIWASNNSLSFKKIKTASQYHIFHSILDFLAVESPIYNKDMSVLEK